MEPYLANTDGLGFTPTAPAMHRASLCLSWVREMAPIPSPLSTSLPQTRLPSAEKINFKLLSLAVLTLCNLIPEFFSNLISHQSSFNSSSLFSHFLNTLQCLDLIFLLMLNFLTGMTYLLLSVN